MSDKTRLQPLGNSVHPIPHGAKAVRRTPGQKWLEVTLGVRRAKALPPLTNLDATKPANRTYLTRKQLSDEYGPDPKAAADIEAYAKTHNLIVTMDCSKGTSKRHPAGMPALAGECRTARSSSQL